MRKTVRRKTQKYQSSSVLLARSPFSQHISLREEFLSNGLSLFGRLELPISAYSQNHQQYKSIDQYRPKYDLEVLVFGLVILAEIIIQYQEKQYHCRADLVQKALKFTDRFPTPLRGEPVLLMRRGNGAVLVFRQQDRYSLEDK